MFATVPNGSEVAADIRPASDALPASRETPKTLGDLLRALEQKPPKAFGMLRTTSSLLATYVGTNADDLSINSVSRVRKGFRPFLAAKKYSENSIRSYLNYTRILLNAAAKLGWKEEDSAPEAWKAVLRLAANKHCADLAQDLSSKHACPRDVLIDDVEEWVSQQIQGGMPDSTARIKRSRFWHVLRECGCTDEVPTSLIRPTYGVSLRNFPQELRDEVSSLLQWKTADFRANRPNRAKHRAVTSARLEAQICTLFGYARDVAHRDEITSLSQLVTEETVAGYMEWCIDTRRVRGESLLRNLRLLHAAMRQYPKFADLKFDWFSCLLNSLPVESGSERRKRKAQKYLDYEKLEAVPDLMRLEGVSLAKRSLVHQARLAMKELLIRWLIVLPWRQRNLRECRIGGTRPNLFKGSLPPLTEIDLPTWASEELKKNPRAEFWQFRFDPDETKMRNYVHALLPRQLITPLEEYLERFRPRLLRAKDPGTLFLNEAGKPLVRTQLTRKVSEATLRYGGRRVTPHMFRDIVAYIWLKEHPKDYLTLSKILWHSNINTTINTYGGRFNESSGVCAMEAWLDGRVRTEN